MPVTRRQFMSATAATASAAVPRRPGCGPKRVMADGLFAHRPILFFRGRRSFEFTHVGSPVTRTWVNEDLG